ncbi:hypothetical protein ACHAPE_001975 [Trichoderma viride]
MEHDIETAPDAIDGQDERSEENASQNQGLYKPDLDKSTRAAIHEKTGDYSSARPESVASARSHNIVRERRGYELQPDSILVSSLELGTEGRIPVRSSESDIPRRVNTFGTEADVNTEDEALDRFLIQYMREDIFSLDIHQISAASLSVLKSKVFNTKRLIKKEAEPQVTTRLSLEALNRMRMRRLQMKLSNRIMQMHYFEEIPKDWETLLVQYIKATRDNDYIRTCVDRGLHDPFLIRSERKVDAALLNAGLLRILPERLEKELFLQSVYERTKFNFVPPLERNVDAIDGLRDEIVRR